MRSVNAELWVEGSRLFARPRSERGETTVELRYGVNLLAFAARADLAHQCSEFGVGGWDVAAKEAIEETAWTFQPHALLGTYLWRNPANGVSMLRFAFIGAVRDFDPARSLDTGIVRTHWLTRGELVARSARLRSPLVIRCIDDYLAGQRMPLDSVACLDLDAAAQVRAVNL